MTVQEMIKTHPQPTSLDRDALLRCIDECFDCAATCTSCADACLGEKDVQELVRCIRLNLDCADDRCDEPSGSADQERFFTGGYRRMLLDGVGHFPHREAPDDVALKIERHLEPAAGR